MLSLKGLETLQIMRLPDSMDWGLLNTNEWDFLKLTLLKIYAKKKKISYTLINQKSGKRIKESLEIKTRVYRNFH